MSSTDDLPRSRKAGTHNIRVGLTSLLVTVDTPDGSAIEGGGATPLLMCNGIGARMDVLDPLVAAIGNRPVIRFDAPGAGDSATPVLPYTFAALAYVVGKMLDQLHYERVDVLGYSWGGALAQQFAFQNPRRCRRLVLAATSTGTLMVPAKPRVLAKMLTPRRFNDSQYLSSIAASIYGGTAEVNSAAVSKIVDSHRAVSSNRGYLYQLLAGSMWTSLTALPLIRQPTLVVAGTDDPLIPYVNAKIMARLLPRARLLTHGGGHLDLLISAPELGPQIAAFLDAPVP